MITMQKMKNFFSRLTFLPVFILVSNAGFAQDETTVADTAIIKGKHIVITPLNQDILSTKTKTPTTDRIFKNFSLPQIELILQKTQDKIKLSADEEQKLSALLDQNNERFIEIFRRSEILDEIIMRQAEILYDKVQTKFFEENAEYNLKLDAYGRLMDQYEKKEISELPEPPKPPIKDFNKVVWLYDYVVNEIPESKYVPDALYNKAYVIGWEDQNSDLGIRTLEVLIRKYPNSRYVLESNWLIGEFLFNSADDAKLRRARSHYQKVLELSAESEYPTRRFGESLYRLAWISYKLRNFSDAIAYFTFLMDDIQQNKELFDGQPLPSFVKPEMFDEAAQYIGICFMDIVKREYAARGENPPFGEPLQRLISYFGNFNPPKQYEPWVYEKLGQNYAEADEIKEIINVYEYVNNRFPDSERAAFLAREIIELKDRETNATVGLQEVEAKETLYALRSTFFDKFNYRSAWYKNQLDKFNRQNGVTPDSTVKGTVKRFLDADMFTQVDSMTQKYFIDNVNMDLLYAEAFSGNSPREGISANQERAVTYYERFSANVFNYFDFYSRYDSVAYNNGFYLALVLDTRLNRKQEAYPLYLEISRNPFSEEHRFNASLNAIGIAQGNLEQERATQPPITLASLPRARTMVSDSVLQNLRFLPYVDTLAMTVSENQLIESFDNFTRLYPHLKQAPGYIENIILFYFNKNQLNEVSDWQVTLQKYYPDTKMNQEVVLDLMQGYFRVKDYPMAEKLARTMIYMPSASEKNKEYAKLLWSTSIGLYANILQDRKDYYGAAEQWYRIYNETPEYKDVDQAVYFAAENFDKIKEFNRSNELYNLVIEKFPKSEKLVDNAHINIFANYLEMGAFSLASKQAEKNYYYFAARNDDKKAEEYLYTSFDMAKKAKDLSEAFRLSELYVGKYPDSEFASEVLFGTIGLQSELKDEKGVFEAYGKFANQYPNDFRTVEAFYRRGVYLEKQTDPAGALEEYRKAAQRNDDLKASGLASSPFYAGESNVKLGREIRKGYDAIQIDYNNSAVNQKLKDDQKKQYWANQIKIKDLGLEPGGSLYRSVESVFNIGQTQEIISKQLAERNASDAGYRGADYLSNQANVYYEASGYYETAYNIYNQTYTTLKGLNTQILSLLEQNKDSITTNDITIPDSTLKLLSKLDSVATEKTSEMLYYSANYVHKAVDLYMNDRSVLEQETDPNVYLLVGQALIERPSEDIFESLKLYRKAIDLSEERGIENQWVQNSRQAITDLSDLKATKYVELVDYAITSFDNLFQNFRNKVEVNEEPPGDEILTQEAIMNTGIETTNLLVSTTITAFVDALGIIDSNKLGKDLRLQVELRATEFLLKTGNENLSRSFTLEPIKRQYDQVFLADNDKYWYADAMFTVENVQLTLKSTGLLVLENGIGLMNNFGVFTQFTGQIITRLIAIDPQTYGKLLGEIDLRGSLVFESDYSWRATANFPDDWFRTDLDDSTWNYAESSDLATSLTVDFFDNLAGPKSYKMRPIWFYQVDAGSSLDSYNDNSGIRYNRFVYSSVNDTDIVSDSLSLPVEESKPDDSGLVDSVQSDLQPYNEFAPSDTTSGYSDYPVSDSLDVVSDTTRLPVYEEPTAIIQPPAPPVITLTNRFDYPAEGTVSERPDDFDAYTVPDQVVFRKTFMIDGAVETAVLILGKNIGSEVFLNDNQLDASVFETTVDGKSQITDVSRFLLRGRNVLAIKADATGKYNKNLYSMINLTYFPDVPADKVLKMFSKNNEIPGMQNPDAGNDETAPPVQGEDQNIVPAEGGPNENR